ncbi:MAG: rRNA maturation RNase YbeY [Desulfovibrionaceae bacterium]
MADMGERGRISVHMRCAWLLALAPSVVARLVRTMLLSSPCPELAIDVYIVRDGAMARYNYRHMGCAGPTNILSFPACAALRFGSQRSALSVPADAATLILSADTARREAFLYGQDLEEYTVWLLAHGMGHLLGYDHGVAMDTVCARFYAAARQELGLLQ